MAMLILQTAKASGRNGINNHSNDGRYIQVCNGREVEASCTMDKGDQNNLRGKHV